MNLASSFRPASLMLAAILLVGCGAARPGLPAVTRRAAALAARDAAPTPITQAPAGAVVAAEVRLPLTEEAFVRLRAAYPFKPQAPRVDLYFDRWDGATFRRSLEPAAPKLRLKLKEGRVTWQASQVLERRQTDAAGLPIGITVTRSQEGVLESGAAQPVVAATEAFFLRLEAGGLPLRQQAAAVDAAWRALSWEGAPAFGLGPSVPPPGAVAPQRLAQAVAAGPLLVPSASKRRAGWKLELPRDQAGGGLALFLHLDEARDEAGRWREAFEIEAEPREQLTPEAAAAELGRLLAASGLTREDVAAERGDATAYTASQLRMTDAYSPFTAPPLQGLEGRRR